MKKVLLAALSLISVSAMAQSFTVNDTLTAGDSQFFWTADSGAADLAGTTGAAVTWDYSTLKMYANQTNIDTIMWATDSPDYADFASAIYNDNISQGTSSFFKNMADSVMSYGYKFTADGMDVKIMYDNDPLKYLELPMVLNDTYTDSVKGTVDVDGNTGTVLGEAEVILDGTGTLNLGTSSMSDVLRVKLTETLSTTVVIFGNPVSGTVTRTVYTYYNLNSEKMPVFIHATINVNSSLGSTVVNAVYSSVELEAFSANVNEETLGDITVYPNPADNMVSVELPSKVDELTVLNTLGQNIFTITNPSFKEQINISSLEKGIYFIQINKGNATKTKKLIVK